MAFVSAAPPIRIAVLSDLHNEFDRAHQESQRRRRGEHKRSRSRKRLEALGHPTLGPPLGELVVVEGDAVRPVVDLLVIAGDTDLGAAAARYAGEVAAWLGVPVIFVAGNHEFYDGDYHDVVAGIAETAAGYPDVHFLDNATAEFKIHGRRVRVLGTTLWTDYRVFGEHLQEEAMAQASFGLTDHHVIIFGWEGLFEPRHAAELHERAMYWLERELRKPFDSWTVVVTHHAPSMRSVPTMLRKDLLTASYASHLEPLIERSRVAAWVHGHIHTNADFEVSNTRVVCNPRGYRPSRLNRKFRPSLVVEI